jgi:translocation and assembly module TamB
MRKFFKIVGWLCAAVLVVALLLIIALQLPFIQNTIAQRAVAQLSERLDTRIGVERVRIRLPRTIRINGLYIEDQNRDTLWYSETISVKLDMVGLLRSRVNVHSVLLENITADINKTYPDELYNFDFIAAAFAGDGKQDYTVPEENKKNTGKPPDISVKSIELKNITARYHDEVEGDKIEIILADCAFGFDEIDLERSRFSLSHFRIDGFDAGILQTKEKEPVEAEPGEPFDLDIIAGLIDLSSINIRYGNDVSGDLFHIDLQSLRMDDVSYSAPSNEVGIVALQLASNSFLFQSTHEQEKDTVHGGIDFNDVHVTGIEADMEDLHFAGETGSVQINSVALREKSGLTLEQFSANVAVGETSARIEDLLIRTGASNISGSFNAEYSSLDYARGNPGSIHIDFSLDESLFGFNDVLLLQPGLSDQFRLENTGGVTISVSVNGRVDDLTVGMVDGKLPEGTRLKAYGRITGLTDIETAFFDLTLEEVTTGRDDITRLVSEEMLPDNIVIPSSITMSGTYKGSITEFETFIDVRTTVGSLIAGMEMNMREGQERYEGNIIISDFDIGQLLDQTDRFGKLSLTASVEGAGFDRKSMDAYLDATVDQAYIQGYNYTDLYIDGRFRNRQFTGYAGMDDPNLTFRFNGDVHFTEEDEPVFAFEFDLQHADLYALGFTDLETAMRVSIDADIVGSSVETIDGKVIIRDFLITQEHDHYPLDSLVVTAAATPGHSHVTVISDFLTAEYEGNITIAEVQPVIINHINRYFELHHIEDDVGMADNFFSFTIELHKTDLLAEVLLPELHELSPATIEGHYTHADHNLNIKIHVPEVKYGSYEVDSIRVHVVSGREYIEYDIRSSRFEMPSISMIAPELYGAIEGNTISTHVALYDRDNTTVFAFGSVFESKDTVYTVALLPGELILNYEDWNVPEENYIRFGGDHLFIHNLVLDKNGSRIAIRSEDDGTPAPPVEIAIADFDLTDISRLLGNDEFELRGYINGNALLSDVFDELKLQVDMHLSDFVFGGSEVGEIALRIHQDVPHRYDVGLDIGQQDNHVNVTGYIVTAEDEGEINLEVDIQNINLASIEGFTMGQLSDMTGSLAGAISITGSPSAPDLNGSVNFRDASFLVTQLNSRFALRNEVIEFNRNGLSFRDVTIVDANNNRAVIGGNILMQDFTEYRFALNVRSHNFMLMYTERRHNELFYGRILIDSDIRIRGDQNQPIVNASIGLKEGTNLTIVVPEQDPEVIERAGVVEFVRMDENHQPIRDADDIPDTVRTAVQGIDLTANIEVDPQTAMRVIIDEQAGDYLQVRGGGTLSFGIDPSGLVSIAGRYEVTDGVYQMTFYDVARRRFDIRPGSSIVWSGDPMDAVVDMSAIYTVRVSVVDLVTDQVDDVTRQQYRRALPFQVYLNMRGNLLTPDISFEIDMPEDQRGAFGGVVYQQVQQLNQNETEKNKQVFALLVLNRFLPENPFEIGEGAGLTATARTSASRLLTSQLNALSGRYIRGLDISFEVESYEEYTETGPEGRTELQLQVSQRFLDDRLVVEVGGQFDLEGERARQTEISDIAGNVAVEYLITEDGRFRIRGFRKTEFSALGDGEVIFTGLSFVYSREFNRFMDLFRRPRDVVSAPGADIVGGEGR